MVALAMLMTALAGPAASLDGVARDVPSIGAPADSESGALALDGSVAGERFERSGLSNTTAAAIDVSLYTYADLDLARSVWNAVGPSVDQYPLGGDATVRTALDDVGAHQFDRGTVPLEAATPTTDSAASQESQPALLTGVGLVGLAFFGRRRSAHRGRERR